MWLNFDSWSRFPVAVKVAAGKINVVTGEPWVAGLNRNPQDYMFAPGQPWLDGFAIEKGVIRQFVAMPLGEGYSVEEQLSGRAEWGDLQISVTPLKREVWELENSPLEHADYRLEPQMSRSVSEIAMGAGGGMRQSIERDRCNFEDWDQPSARSQMIMASSGETSRNQVRHSSMLAMSADEGTGWAAAPGQVPRADAR